MTDFEHLKYENTKDLFRQTENSKFRLEVYTAFNDKLPTAEFFFETESQAINFMMGRENNEFWDSMVIPYKRSFIRRDQITHYSIVDIDDNLKKNNL